jgi:hypothetical protein
MPWVTQRRYFFFGGHSMSIVPTVKESATRKLIVKSLSGFFHIRHEIWGVHSVTNERKRIDTVLVPMQILTSQGFPNLPIGLELKPTAFEDGNKKQLIELGKQAVDYRLTRFKMASGKHFLPLILIYPPSDALLTHLGRADFADGFAYHHSRLLGKWFIGELLLKELGFEIWLCGERYYRMKSGVGKRRKKNWGFEKYEDIKKELREQVANEEEYQRVMLQHVHLLGI